LSTTPQFLLLGKLSLLAVLVLEMFAFSFLEIKIGSLTLGCSTHLVVALEVSAIVLDLLSLAILPAFSALLVDKGIGFLVVHRLLGDTVSGDGNAFTSSPRTSNLFIILGSSEPTPHLSINFCSIVCSFRLNTSAILFAK
jgi:hypothetical protein